MPIYRVMLSGSKVILRSDTGREICGFVRNEYVKAASEDLAIERAKAKALERVAETHGIELIEGAPLQLTVDEVEKGVSAWKLMRNESFVFFDAEDDGGRLQ